jgi:hypothetical protein
MDVTAFVVTVNGKLRALAVRFKVPGTITAELSLVRVAVSIIVISQGASKFMLPAVLCPPTIVGGAKVTSLTSCALAIFELKIPAAITKTAIAIDCNWTNIAQYLFTQGSTGE